MRFRRHGWRAQAGSAPKEKEVQKPASIVPSILLSVALILMGVAIPSVRGAGGLTVDVVTWDVMGLDSNDVLSPAEVARAAMEGGTVTIRRPFVCEVKRVRVNAKPRIEISGAPADQLAWLKSIGCFTEIIAYKTRVFIPVETADAVLAKLMA